MLILMRREGEVITIGDEITATEIDKLFGCLHHKWGLEALLPALHPYKAAPP